MLRFLPALVLLSLGASLLSGSTWGAASPPATYLVGYDPMHAREAQLAIQAGGGNVKRSSPELGFSVVTTDQPALFLQAMAVSPYVQYVENDKPTTEGTMLANGAQWNGAQWNGAQWNGAQWNGAQWNGAQWNGAQWNTVGASPAQQQAQQWAVKLYNSAGGSKYRYDTTKSDPGLVWQWGSWAIRAPAAWLASKGTDAATLCVLDSGVAWDHPDLAANAWSDALGNHGWNAQDPAASAYDDAGHGTHVAGVAAAATENSMGVAGVGNARIMSAKVLDKTGQGNESDLAFGLVWCANNGAKVALMALSITDTGPTLDRALQYAYDHDVLMVASAGNGGGAVAYPAADARVVGVEALDGNLTLAPFSARGAGAEVSAPGVDVLGTFPGGAYAFGSGTSQAAAYAAGVAALVRDANPALSAADATRILETTGQRAPDAPLLDAQAALSQAMGSSLASG